ncbi:uncharacterized protein LOC131956622 [Physella acuta]|uniref:uncharacterized protein LOC131956622 n=1 Tax=Physella acuta TaxID=109671 RepID=UPI0027DD8C10|nr:uncharacterized protein LOC131956622 [Physella acuta]
MKNEREVLEVYLVLLSCKLFIKTGRSRKFGGISVLLAKEKVCQKERENQERARLMEMAIEEISTRDPGVLQEIIRIHQLKQNIATAGTQRSSNNEPFKLICPMCRTVEIQGSDVRNIMGKYFVPVDRALFDGLKIKCKTHAPEPMDGLEFVGEIFCNGDTEPGKKCGHKLGIMIKYGSVPYLSIKADKFGFLFGNMTIPKIFKRWKQAQEKLYIAELTKDDIKRYIQLTDEDFAGLHESDEETSSSDDE